MIERGDKRVANDKNRIRKKKKRKVNSYDREENEISGH